VREHRGDLLGAALTIWRGWIAAGRPKAHLTMGSFERWASAVGGALSNSGINGFLDGTTEWLDFSDPDNDGWGEHLAKLHAAFGGSRFTVRDVVALWETGEISLPHHRREPDRTMAHVIGNMYRSARGRWWGRYRLEPSRERNSATGGRTWTVFMRGSDVAAGSSATSLRGVSFANQRPVATEPRPPLAESAAVGTDTTDTAGRHSSGADIDPAVVTAVCFSRPTGHLSGRAADGVVPGAHAVGGTPARRSE